MKKRIICIITILMVLFVMQAVPVCAADSMPSVKCSGAILVDYNTGKVLYEKNADTEIPPASTTKIMTCMLVLERKSLSDEVTVPAAAAGMSGNTMKLKKGEVLTVRQLLYALMLHSANDAAVALAIDVSGSVDSFCDLMNQKAAQLGADSTHFISPNGFTNSSRHHTTARDMSVIASWAMKNSTFRKLVRTSRYVIPATNKSARRVMKTTNKLLYDTKKKDSITVNGEKRTPKYKGTIGIKTGFMAASGYCLVAAAKQKDTEYIAVVLKSPTDLNRYSDAVTMLDYGFDNFYTSKLYAPGADTGRVKVKYGHKTHVRTTVPNGAYITLPTDGAANLGSSKIVLYKNVKAPVKKGTKVGVVNIYEDGVKTDTADILISESVGKGGPWAAWYISDMTAALAAAAVCIIIVLLIIIRSRRRRARRKREASLRAAREERAMQIAAERAEKARRGWPY